MLVNVDAAGLEWRTALLLSNDEVGIQEILGGEDTHSKNQQDFSLPDRHTAKIYLFRTIYRGTGWSFANDPAFQHVSKSQKYWNGINERFYGKYHQLDATHQGWYRLCAEHKPIAGPTGRQWLILPTTDYKGDYKIPITMISNYPVRGTGHDIVMMARISLKNRLNKYKMQSRIVQTVHDSIVTDGPDDEIVAVSNIMYDVFDDLPKNFKKIFNIDMPIPFPGEVKYGKNLAQMKEIAQGATKWN